MYRLTKKLFDIFLAIILLVILSPLMVTTSLLLLFFQGRPLFFTQRRPGYKEKIFTLYKFRTMNIGEQADDVRLTQIGSIVRKLSLDELPQLLNILKGEISFVGPRPLLEEYLSLYSKEQRKRHDTIPGITGWAQVNGRNTISWEERFNLDIYYVNNQSLLLDLKIVVLTIVKVIAMRGVSAPGTKTMNKFEGAAKK